MTVTDRLEGIDYNGVPGDKADNTMALSRLYRRFADAGCLSSAMDGNYNFLPDRLRLELLSQSDRAETLQFGTVFDAGGEDAQCFQLLRLDKTPYLRDSVFFKRWVGVAALEKPDKILSLMDVVVPGGSVDTPPLSEVLDNLEVLLVATFFVIHASGFDAREDVGEGPRFTLYLGWWFPVVESGAGSERFVVCRPEQTGPLPGAGLSGNMGTNPGSTYTISSGGDAMGHQQRGPGFS
jgi:hypothetical protein